MKKLLVYSDALHVGGHEFQFLNALKLLEKKYNVMVIVNNKNSNFIERLEQMDLKLVKTGYSSSRLQSIRSFFSFAQIFFILRVIKKFNPTVILNLQGNIELGSVMSVAAKIARVKLITYIPICHKLKTVSKRKFFAIFKDWLNLIYYRLPDGFITINEFNKSLINDRVPSVNIKVVYNGIDFDSYKKLDKFQSLKSLGLNSRNKHIALIGRVEFWHKGQDILLKMFDKYYDELKFIKILIVGTGEDESKLKSLVIDKGLTNQFIFLGHQKELSQIYSSLDGVVIPSRFESGAGTPMVLLESLFYKIPVIMSELPEVEEYLNKEYLFPIGDVTKFYERFKLILEVESLAEFSNKFVVSRHSLTEFQVNFDEALSEFV